MEKHSISQVDKISRIAGDAKKAIAEFFTKRRLRWMVEAIIGFLVLAIALQAMGARDYKLYLFIFVMAMAASAFRGRDAPSTGEGDVIAVYDGRPFPPSWLADIAIVLSGASLVGSFAGGAFTVNVLQGICYAAGGVFGLVYQIRFAMALFGPGTLSTEGKAVDLKARRWLLIQALFAVAASAAGMAVAAASA